MDMRVNRNSVCRNQCWVVVVNKRQLLRLRALERVEDLPATEGSCFHSPLGERRMQLANSRNSESLQGDYYVCQLHLLFAIS